MVIKRNILFKTHLPKLEYQIANTCYNKEIFYFKHTYNKLEHQTLAR